MSDDIRIRDSVAWEIYHLVGETVQLVLGVFYFIIFFEATAVVFVDGRPALNRQVLWCHVPGSRGLTPETATRSSLQDRDVSGPFCSDLGKD